MKLTILGKAAIIAKVYVYVSYTLYVWQPHPLWSYGFNMFSKVSLIGLLVLEMLYTGMTLRHYSKMTPDEVDRLS